MKVSDIPFNMEVEIQEDLREAPKSYDGMEKGVGFLKDEMNKTTDELNLASIYSLIGNYSRILLKLADSEKFLNFSLEIYEKHELKIEAFAVKIQLATTYLWNEQFTKADKFFLSAIKLCEKSQNEKIKDYLDFVIQHYGKSKFEQKCYHEANVLFVRAMELRVVKGNLELMESSQKALTVVNKFISN
ncbi:hypothetical protein A9Q84_09425 [Halobacteriovorax marinus]|uniref:Tetratricopeptide repeat protein n=1 Tax=Halobacteriovorax marinus TaxID=97084 RepID=A0A1Y5FC73_9BACT|nr:hypothetical protein A9Q84_09425 [Halobacteriovorax marinus]